MFWQNSQTWIRKGRKTHKNKKHRWNVSDALAVARVSLDGFTKVSSKSSGRIEPWQFCLSGQIVFLEVTGMLDDLLVMQSDIITRMVNNSLILPLIEEIASCIYEYCYSSKHKWIFYYCETISCKFSFFIVRDRYTKKKDNCLLRQTIVILASSRQWSSSSVFIAVKKKNSYIFLSEWTCKYFL